MATQVECDGTLEITAIADNWDYKASKPANWPKIPRLSSIEYHPGGADTCVIRESGATGPACFYASCADANDSRIKYFHGKRQIPYLLFSDCTLNAGHKLIISLWRDP